MACQLYRRGNHRTGTKARDNGTKLPVDAQWLGGTYSEKSQAWHEASALSWVNEKSAPVCFINSSIPRFHNGRDEQIQLLELSNIYSEVHTFEKVRTHSGIFHPWHISTVNYMANFLNKIFQKNASEFDRKGFDIVVAQDGSGDFISVQQAINAVPDFRKKQTQFSSATDTTAKKIIIPETKDNLILVGEDKFKTILSFNNFASKPTGFGDQLGTSGSASVYISPANFSAKRTSHLKMEPDQVGQAVAVIVAKSEKAQFYNCRFLGFQDALHP